MRYLLILLFIFGCGIDPDDYKPEESDGCKSTDLKCQGIEIDDDMDLEEEEFAWEEDKETSQTSDQTGSGDQAESITVNTQVNINVIVGPSGEKIDKDNADNCMAGRICRGLTKGEVIDLIGEPETIKKQDPFEVWTFYSDYGSLIEVCGLYSCTLTFRDGQVVDQDGVKAQWLDLENF